jgi:hypothetical protein
LSLFWCSHFSLISGFPSLLPCIWFSFTDCFHATMMAQRILKSWQTPILRFLVYFERFKDCLYWVRFKLSRWEKWANWGLWGNGFRTSFAFSFEWMWKANLWNKAIFLNSENLLAYKHDGMMAPLQASLTVNLMKIHLEWKAVKVGLAEDLINSIANSDQKLQTNLN